MHEILDALDNFLKRVRGRAYGHYFPAGRKAISEATKKRWAAFHAAQQASEQPAPKKAARKSAKKTARKKAAVKNATTKKVAAMTPAAQALRLS